MATLVLTVIGTAIGGPLGGAIGSMAGQVIDAEIFKPKGREGPRLADLSVQISRYGAQIPRVYGTMRVAGSVIWSTDLRETRSKSSGKGRASVTSFSYAASFAVALSSRPIRGIGRIWADGNLLRGAAGDLKVSLGALRVHDGSAGQGVDPLIASAQSLEQTPAYRGLAYIVLEDLQLADFGNRLPSLTVEVFADDSDVPVSAIASDLLDRPVAWHGPGEPAVDGYAASGTDAGEALAPLTGAFALRWRPSEDDVALAERVGTAQVLLRRDMLHLIDEKAEPPEEKRRIPFSDTPARLSIRHFDPARDYQLGVQTAERAGAGEREEEVGLPAVMAADAARGLAHRTLWMQVASRRRMTRTSGWRALALVAGDVVAVEGETGSWIVDRIEWQDMAPRINLRGIASYAALTPTAADAGQPVLPPDLVQGATSLVLLELPPPGDRMADAPIVAAAATGATAAWRRAALLRYDAITETAEPAGSTAPRAVIGTALTALADGAAWTIDMNGTVDVMLDNAADSLLGASDGELVRDANLCALGQEILQFGRAEPLGAGRYRLSRLIRGWHGTEWAIAGHAAGERFVLIDPERLALLAATCSDIGRPYEMRAIGAGDDVPAEAALFIDGRAVLPPSPVHPVVRQDGEDLILGWTRRSRLGWHWRDGADVPLTEEREAYRLTISAGASVLRQVETTAPMWTYPAAERAADGAAAGSASLTVAVAQLGTFGGSRPLIFAIF